MQAIDVSNLFQDIRENYEKYANSDTLEEQFLAIRFKQIEQYIKTFPVVEVEPVKRGEWINTYGDTPLDPRDKNYWWHCSECGHSVSTSFKSNFCPCCGARMEGD